MKRTRREDDGQPTPHTNRERIVALEGQIVRLEKVIDQHQRDLDVQLQRIGQLQAELDAIRAAWVKVKAPRRRG